MVTDGSSWPSVNELDYIIDDVHANAVDTNIRETFEYVPQISLGGAAVSEQSVDRLTELENSYGWTIVY